MVHGSLVRTVEQNTKWASDTLQTEGVAPAVRKNSAPQWSRRGSNNAIKKFISAEEHLVLCEAIAQPSINRRNILFRLVIADCAHDSLGKCSFL